VLLRPLEINDLEHLAPFTITEPDLWEYAFVRPEGIAGMRTYIETTLEARRNETEYAFIVYDKQKERYAGTTRFYIVQVPYSCTSIGYTWYGKEFQGTGLNRHCKFLLLQFAFEQMDMERVEFRADQKNARSIAAMKSIGCTIEGVMRNNLPRRGGGRIDSVILSILKEEWLGDVKERLQAKL
jgi:N-acetyltransferase